MKWLLITTRHTNPGDEFARIGVENIIRSVDDNPVFDLLNKEDTEHWHEREFDRCIYAGMPLWWSMEGNECQDIFWWGPLIRGWPTKDPRKFMVLGSGSVYVDKIHDTNRYMSAILETMERSWAVTTRNSVFDHPGIVDSICPSAFAISNPSMARPFKLCNFMRDGGHFPHNDFELDHWDAILPLAVEWLLKGGFKFVAHTPAEVEYARELGWTPDNIFFFAKAEDYLPVYNQAIAYFGNRLHGGAVCASIGARTWCVTHDSRLQFVKRLGALTTRPSEISRDALKAWIKFPRDWGLREKNIEFEFGRLRDLILRFVHQ